MALNLPRLPLNALTRRHTHGVWSQPSLEGDPPLSTLLLYTTTSPCHYW